MILRKNKKDQRAHIKKISLLSNFNLKYAIILHSFIVISTHQSLLNIQILYLLGVTLLDERVEVARVVLIKINLIL